MSFEDATMGKVNPHYYENNEYNEEYFNNCVCCVLALEARLRGYTVHASAQFFEGKLNELAEHPFWAWIDNKTGKKCEGQVMNAETSIELIKNIESIVNINERYNFLYYQEQILDNEIIVSAHIISIDRDKNGNLRFYDPQNDRLRQGMDIKGFIDAQIDLSKSEFKPLILRVDDKIINLEYANVALIAD